MPWEGASFTQHLLGLPFKLATLVARSILSYPQSMEARTRLRVNEHSRDAVGLTYVYPVVSRRAAGVSVGINLNPNNASNWRCIYCQVPGLQRGTAPTIDVALLQRELRDFLKELLAGNFMERYVPVESRRISDIALSGNGEPTSAREFEVVVSAIGRVMRDFGLLDRAEPVKLVVITNGSLANRPEVRRAMRRMAELNGEVWFKFDRGTDSSRRTVNGTIAGVEGIAKKLEISASLCATWIQTCLFQLDGQLPDAVERASYLRFLQRLKQCDIGLRGILLYGIARPSMQPEAPRLSNAPRGHFEVFAKDIEALGFPVRLNP